MAECRNALDLDPHYYMAHINLGIACIVTGRLDEAIRTLENVAQSAERSPHALGFLGIAYALAGRVVEAQKLLDELQELARKRYVPSSSFMWIYFALGEIDKGFEWLEKAVDVRDSGILHSHLYPISDPLRSRPRYAALLHKMNLEPDRPDAQP